MKLVYFKDEDPDNVYLVLGELDDSYILGLLEYPDIEMDFSTPKDVVIEIQENTEEYKKEKQITLNKLNTSESRSFSIVCFAFGLLKNIPPAPKKGSI